MPRAEAGSLKHLSNQMKSKGLQRLRWYCEVCQKQCRDENGFKCHTMSESHVRNMQHVGQNAKAFIDNYSNDFKRDFLQLLRTSHGTKPVHMNHFYQQYISNKTHVHMNATKWKSLTEFAKYLGREGICKVEETDKGLHIAWIDRSPEALRRQEEVRKKERQQQGDQKLEEKMIQQQVERAQQAAAAQAAAAAAVTTAALAAKTKDSSLANEEEKKTSSPPQQGPKMAINFEWKLGTKNEDNGKAVTDAEGGAQTVKLSTEEAPAAKPTMKMSFGGGSNGLKTNNGLKPKNGLKKGNALSSKKAPVAVEPTRKMTEAERIMREEMEAERKRKERGFGDRDAKRVKI